MNNVLILGAAGSIARIATDLFLQRDDVTLTLFLRNTRRLQMRPSARVRVVEGDVRDRAALLEAMKDQHVVYANLAGDLAPMAGNVVHCMHQANVRRLVWISSMGIYSEVPGEKYSRILDPYRDSARVIEESDLDYTILRPGWFTSSNEVHYEITQKGEPFRGHDVSRRSVASLVVRLSTTPGLHVRESLGVSSAG